MWRPNTGVICVLEDKNQNELELNNASTSYKDCFPKQNKAMAEECMQIFYHLCKALNK